MKDFLFKLGNTRNKHPELMDIDKYRQGDYYDNLLKEFEAAKPDK